MYAYVTQEGHWFFRLPARPTRLAFRLFVLLSFPDTEVAAWFATFAVQPSRPAGFLGRRPLR